MILGFSGTRDGMSTRQSSALTDILASMYERHEHIFVHGDCIGSDAEAAILADHLCWVVEARPCTIENMRAHTERRIDCAYHEPKPPLIRNQDIVNQCEILIAAPKSLLVQKGGTWATIHYARKIGRPVIILDP